MSKKDDEMTYMMVPETQSSDQNNFKIRQSSENSLGNQQYTTVNNPYSVSSGSQIS